MAVEAIVRDTFPNLIERRINMDRSASTTLRPNSLVSQLKAICGQLRTARAM